MDVGHEAQRALGAHDQLGQIKDASFAVPDVPEIVAGGVFADVRFGGFDLIVMLVDQLEQLAVDFALEILLLHFFVEFGLVEWFDGALHAIGKDKLQFGDEIFGLAKFQRFFAARVVIDHAADTGQVARGRIAGHQGAVFQRLRLKIPIEHAGLGVGSW